jgi:Saxitoxin biosynthesis operon protein SxtJ
MPGASPSELRRFGLTVGGMFVLLGLASWWRGHEWPPRVFWTLGVLLVVPGLLAPAVLGPVQRGWMRFGALLGEVNSRIILTVMFYLVFAPFGWIMRTFVRDPLDRSFAGDEKSHWIKRDVVRLDPARYEQQF